MADEEVKLSKNEYLKIESHQLRGTLFDELANNEDHFTEDATQILKFHGSYQQDDRDQRKAKDAEGKPLGKQYSCMIRSAIPGGRVTAAQFLGHLDLADNIGIGNVRITTRQGFQLHGIPKKSLREVIHHINKIHLTTSSACGDVNRNVMCNPAPFKNNTVIDMMQDAADRLSQHLKPKSTAYYELWIKDDEGNSFNAAEFTPVEEPIYGQTYLPRKFKIGFALPEDNHVDAYTQDIGFMGIVENDGLIGFNVLVGGGMGRTPSAAKTFPALGQLLGFIPYDQVLPVAEAIVKVQRDFGNRSDRKVARMKYLVNEWGIEKFKTKVEEYYGGSIALARPMETTGADDYMGWHEQGDGKLFLGVNVECGRLKDEGPLTLKKAFREILTKYGMESRLTALQSVILCDIDPSWKSDIDSILKANGIRLAEDLTFFRLNAIACPALPLCGLAVTESERIYGELVSGVEDHLESLGLTSEKITMHMTGCPNGCARPYTPDIGIVGKAAGKYTIFLGGNNVGSRLGYIYKDMVPHDDLIPTIGRVLKTYKSERQDGEKFGDFCHRLGAEKLAEQSA